MTTETDTDTDPDASAELAKLAANINGMFAVAGEYLQTDAGKDLLKRGSLFLDAVGSGGFLPESGVFSTPWLAFFLARVGRSIERQTVMLDVPKYAVGNQNLHRAADFVQKASVSLDVSEEEPNA